MPNRTWNVKLNATDEFPETTLNGVSHDDALKIVRGLMYGPSSPEYKRVENVVKSASREFADAGVRSAA